MDRRAFLGSISVPALVAGGRLDRIGSEGPGMSPDDDPWAEASRAFAIDRSILNLNHGGVSPTCGPALDAIHRLVDESNTCPPHVMWEVLAPRRDAVRQQIARTWKADPETIAITRNATESLQTCQQGIDLAPGDEVLTTTQDYSRMLWTFEQRVKRDHVTLRKIRLPVPAEDDDEIVRRFEEAITPRTRVILMCHVINLTGQILPVRRVVEMARTKGVPVIVDGAHAIAHLDFTFEDLDCDYYGASLHKWLFAPIGTGLLHVRRERIRDLWPLFACRESQVDDIRKFEEVGTHPEAHAIAIAEALAFHESLGGARKFERLVALRDHWAKRLASHDRMHLHTSLKPGRAGGIATIEVLGMDASDVAERLWRDHRILVASIRHVEFQGIRVSPSVSTSIDDLDRFCEVMERIATG